MATEKRHTHTQEETTRVEEKEDDGGWGEESGPRLERETGLAELPAF